MNAVIGRRCWPVGPGLSATPPSSEADQHLAVVARPREHPPWSWLIGEDDELGVRTARVPRIGCDQQRPAQSRCGSLRRRGREPAANSKAGPRSGPAVWERALGDAARWPLIRGTASPNDPGRLDKPVTAPGSDSGARAGVGTSLARTSATATRTRLAAMSGSPCAFRVARRCAR
jgi:hypothetical protein